jgi:dimethylargininase
MRFSHAILRRPAPDMASGLTTAHLGPPDYIRALEQFEAYADALTHCGLSVTILPVLDGFPDAHFVEDTAVVTPEVAIITRPGAPSRKGEEVSIRTALAPFRPIRTIEAPGTIDGGDVLVAGRHVFIGLSERTNSAGSGQLEALLNPFGYTCTAIPVSAGLHFKSSVNQVAADTLLTTHAFAGHPALGTFKRIVVDDVEAYAGNTLLVNGHLIVPAGFPDTREKLAVLGMPIIELDTSEFRKMDGGLTCLSLRF